MSKASFLHSFYSDHLDSISFLYGQRNILRSIYEASWKDIHKFEERLDAHLDALTSDEQALEVCCRQAKESDAGELYAALAVFCRQRQREMLIEVLKQVDPEDKEKQQPVVDALKYELPDEWQDDFASLLQTDNERHCTQVAAVVGYRRIPVGRDLVHALQRFQPPPLIWAAGRLRERSAASLLLAALRHDDDAVCSAAALALLRLGEKQAIDHCREMAGKKGWAVIPLALGGGKSAVPVVLEIATSEAMTPDTLLSLGLLGDSSAAPFLLEKLGGEHAEAAALALNLLTGAELYERVFIPEKVDEDELFPDELEAYRKESKVPTKPDGTPYGEWVTRLSQKPEEWAEWWGRHSHLFQPGTRYRNGKPYSPSTLLENLQHEKTWYRIRQLAYEELVIRYDVDFPFETDMFVCDQLKVLDDMARWVAANSGRFQEGAWYFAGQLMAG